MKYVPYRVGLLCLLLTTLTSAGIPRSGDAEPVITPFNFTHGRFKLNGHLILPDSAGAHPLIIYVWGSGPTRMQAHIERSPILRKFVETGFGVLLYDKPGSGVSTGDFTPDRLFRERRDILLSAIAGAAKSPHVDSRLIGLYGSSQASYVMSMTLHECDRIDFVVSWSCPMENSILQSAYQVKHYLLCGGVPADTADRAYEAFVRGYSTDSYTVYRKDALFLDSIPEIRDELGWGGVAEEADFVPTDTSSESLIDPAKLLKDITIPFLAIYGELDKNINIDQAKEALHEIMQRNPDHRIEIHTIAGADHNMQTGGTGCVQEQMNNYRNVKNRKLARDFSELVTGWLCRVREDVYQ